MHELDQLFPKWDILQKIMDSLTRDLTIAKEVLHKKSLISEIERPKENKA